MSQSPASAPRRIDPAAVHATLGRLAAREAPPWLHAEVARRMAQRLEFIKRKPERIIDWWAFLGAGGELLSAAYPDAERVLVEPDERHARRSREAVRAAWWSPRRWLGTEPAVRLESEDPGPPAQLLWSNMALHAAQDPPALLARWQRCVAADGFVMFSCFGPDTVRELREIYARLGWPPPTIDFVDMHDLGDMLVQAGFADPVMDQETLTLSWETPAALLEELRSLGGNASPERFAGLRTRRWRDRLERELCDLAQPDGRLALRFEIAYGHAFKALPRMRPGEATTVSLDDMRALVKTPRAKP